MASFNCRMFIAILVSAVLLSGELIAAQPSLVSKVDTDAVPAVLEQCKSDTPSASPEEGHALLAHRTKLERVSSGKWHEDSMKTPLLSRNGSSATPEQWTTQLLQLTNELPVQDVEKMVVMMRDISNQRKQLVNSTADPEDEPLLAPAPAIPEYEMPTAHDHVEKSYILARFIVVPISVVFFLVYNLSTVMEKFEITAIPESGVVIAIGCILGWFMKKYTSLDFFEDQKAWAELNTAMLNLMLLPIIVFASGWALRRHDFYSQLPYILLFAVGGTAVSTCAVAGMMYYSGLLKQWRTAFTYASLISATDPVATLTTYSKLKVHPLLNIMVFGESTINDAVAIVLFKIFNSNELMGDPSTGAELSFGKELLINITWGIFKTFFGSLIFGVLLAMLYTLIARVVDMRENKKGQILVIFVSCYLTYALAETVHLSGIIAETFCSLVMGVYMRPHLSNEGCVLTTFFVKQIATLADSGVFLLVGVSVVQLTSNGWKIGVYVTGFCLIARLVSTVPTAYLVNFLKAARGTAAGQDKEEWNLLETKHIFMMWHGGLRGGIALALAWELGAWVDIGEGKPGTTHALQTATFLIILVFLLVFGGSTAALLKYLNIPMGEDYPEDFLSKTEYSGFGLQGLLGRVDTFILTPLLVGDPNAKHQDDVDDGGETSPDADAEDLLKKSLKLQRFCQH